MKLSDLIRRIDSLLEMGKNVAQTRYSEGGPYALILVSEALMAGFRSSSLSFIDRVFGSDHVHFNEFSGGTTSHFYADVQRGLAILSAIRSEIEGGWLFEMIGLVASELFADFLEQAEHLLEQGYKDAAAVMIGSVLEEHIRQLCLKAGLDTYDQKEERRVPRSTDRLNSELARAAVYSSLELKQVTAWLRLRNHAAHGNYHEYTA